MPITETLHATRTPVFLTNADDGTEKGTVANPVAVATPVGVRAPAASQSGVASGLEYETVAAGQTAQVMGATGAVGDYLSHVNFHPAAVGAGTCQVLDGAIVVWSYTAGTLSDLRPIVAPINAISVSGAWKVTTGANMTATGFGDFT